MIIKTKREVQGVSPQGNKIIIIVPKEHHPAIRKLKNPLKVTVEEIIE